MIMFADVRNRITQQLIDLNIASSKTVDKGNIAIKGNGNNFTSMNGRRDDEKGESNGLKVANSIMQDGADLLGTPVRWMKDMQQNWPIYIICAAIILVCITILYCVVCGYCSRRNKRSSDGLNLKDLATILAMKTTASPAIAIP
jgi:hypothetical protein